MVVTRTYSVQRVCSQVDDKRQHLILVNGVETKANVLVYSAFIRSEKKTFHRVQ